MFVVRILAYLSLGAAGLCLFAFLGVSDLEYVVAAVSGVVVGSLMLAIDRALVLLAQIRDNLAPGAMPLIADQDPAENEPAQGDPAARIAALGADLDRFKATARATV